MVCRGEADDLFQVLVEAGGTPPQLLEDLSQPRAVQLRLEPLPHVRAVGIGVAGIGSAEVEELFGDGVGELLAPVLGRAEDEDGVARQHRLEAQIDEVV